MPKRVLIADDSESMRTVLRNFIAEQPGVEVCALTANGIDTIDAAMALQPDLLILDVQMPGLNGVEVASVLRKNLPSAKTVLFTIFGHILSETLAHAVGANAVLAKTDGLPALAKTVQSLLGTRAEVVKQALARAILRGKTSTADLESLTRTLAVPLTRCGRDLKYQWVNEDYAKWLQRPVEKLVGRSIVDVLGKQAFDALLCHFEEVLAGKEVAYEKLAEFDGIGLRRISAAYRAIPNGDGVADGWLAFVEDITERSD